MDTTAYRNEESIVIGRPAGELYDLVSDVANMGRWSPVATGGTFDEDSEWFTGTNSMGGTTWETRCRVVAADPGNEFAFVNHGLEGKVEMVRWAFQFKTLDDGATEVTQTWEVLPDYATGLGVDDADAVAILDRMKDAALSGMPETLAALKADAES
jgi:uncharacterized membrane protein